MERNRANFHIFYTIFSRLKLVAGTSLTALKYLFQTLICAIKCRNKINTRMLEKSENQLICRIKITTK